MRRFYVVFLILLLFSCKSYRSESIEITDIATLAAGWQGRIIDQSTESYMGWDVEIGDADNDGNNEILTTGCPSSLLNMIKLKNGEWVNSLLAENLALSFPGMGLAVRIVDLDNDATNEIIVGTGQEVGGTAFYYTFQYRDSKLTQLTMSRPECNQSSYTHNLAPCDLDRDGRLEVLSAYCGGGEIIRYDYESGLREVKARKIHQLSGSGEESLIADVDNDGEVEFITSNSFRKEDAKVEIFEFDNEGELIVPPRLVIDGYDDKKCFYASLIIGDVDNDNKNELVVGWKQDQKINKGTILGYNISGQAEQKYTFAYEDKDLDLAYFEKMMVVADADNDGKNEFVVSTRGDNMSENIKSEHLGHVFMWSVNDEGVTRELLVNLEPYYAGSSWLAVGDADNDGKNEIIMATGKGDRTQKGASYALLIEKTE
jgi:hypothetical protein